MAIYVNCILACISCSSAIRCYQCNFCGDDFQVVQATIVNCTGSCEKGKRNSGMLCFMV